MGPEIRYFMSAMTQNNKRRTVHVLKQEIKQILTALHTPSSFCATNRL